MIVPALSSRVRAACAISVAKSNVMSTPAFGRPNKAPFKCDIKGRCTLASRHAPPSSSAVTATGEKLDAGLLWKNPNPLAISAGTRLRSETSLTSMRRRICDRAAAGATPSGTSPVITATSASKSIPHASSGNAMSSQGPMKLSEPP